MSSDFLTGQPVRVGVRHQHHYHPHPLHLGAAFDDAQPGLMRHQSQSTIVAKRTKIDDLLGVDDGAAAAQSAEQRAGKVAPRFTATLTPRFRIARCDYICYIVAPSCLSAYMPADDKIHPHSRR